ncbi:MAG: GTPase HflX, partial [Chlamydiales bacterium]|nr:GTPase HflX [Chlamydiales bacterium]
MSELGIDIDDPSKSCAFLVGVYKGRETAELCNEHLDELEELASTFGVPTVGRITAACRKIEAATFIGEGKLKEIQEKLGEATLIIFDDEIS